MNIKGLIKTSLIDYPGKIATTIFVGGCNLRCPYCHNGDLVLTPNNLKTYTESEVWEHIEKRKKLLDGICITGGEPTLYDDLPDFIEKIKDHGLLVKLDTNGTNPEMLKKLLDNNSLDYVAMDIKNSREKYSLTTNINVADLVKVDESIKLLIDSNIDYEFRTTVVRELHDEENFHEMGKWINGAKRYYLQQYEESDKQIKKGFSAYDVAELLRFRDIMNEYVGKVNVRGVEDY
ncbi:MAG: anaerobic ribonucleoside-triphosphate reductase activating protein [Clostridiales bacterium GWE2_32_10]|nr:MAG: anaerobic ribonucleoside-triphosphate reductase activating protein [Clostridiales bacterium GWE2_32_10]HBY21221.1 anaerobic ribonucleoside-triphosphate reductase activating protein [Clostridiales bacterium]